MLPSPGPQLPYTLWAFETSLNPAPASRPLTPFVTQERRLPLLPALLTLAQDHPGASF